MTQGTQANGGTEAPQASQEITNGDAPEGAPEEDLSGGMLDTPALICLAYTNMTSGLFQISVKLPHAPHKIQVMVGIFQTKKTQKPKI
jgi:protein TIF31